MWSGTERPPEYSDCVDVDLSFTPATNTLPIRRLGLDIGEEAEIHVAWLRLARADRPAGTAALHQARGAPVPLHPGRVRGRAHRRPARARSRVRGTLAHDRHDLGHPAVVGAPQCSSGIRRDDRKRSRSPISAHAPEPGERRDQRQPSSGATYFRTLSMTCALYSTPSWFGTVSNSVSAAAIASSWASCETSTSGSAA